jgi:hypothetical protein
VCDHRRDDRHSDDDGAGAQVRRTALRLLALSALAAQTACGILGDDTRPCTLIHSPSGISVELPAALADRTAELSLTACWDGVCRRGAPRPRQLPEEVLDWPGFVPVAGLPDRPVEVTLTLSDSRGGTVLERRTTLTPRLTYANGRGCSPGGAQAGLAVTGRGALVPR